jgi:hypothetical protein
MGNFSNEIQYGESTPALAQATSSIGQPSFQRHETLSVWDWMKFYESARSILVSTVPFTFPNESEPRTEFILVECVVKDTQLVPTQYGMELYKITFREEERVFSTKEFRFFLPKGDNILYYINLSELESIRLV